MARNEHAECVNNFVHISKKQLILKWTEHKISFIMRGNTAHIPFLWASYLFANLFRADEDTGLENSQMCHWNQSDHGKRHSAELLCPQSPEADSPTRSAMISGRWRAWSRGYVKFQQWSPYAALCLPTTSDGKTLFIRVLVKSSRSTTQT